MVWYGIYGSPKSYFLLWMQLKNSAIFFMGVKSLTGIFSVEGYAADNASESISSC